MKSAGRLLDSREVGLSMPRWIRFVLLAFVLITPPALACEKCALHFIDQTQKFCPACEWSYCGYFDCVLRTDGWGTYCDSDRTLTRDGVPIPKPNGGWSM